jgi:hypothetical protein
MIQLLFFGFPGKTFIIINCYKHIKVKLVGNYSGENVTDGFQLIIEVYCCFSIG